MSLKKHIPLFQVLKELKDYQRQIIVNHLDDSTCQTLASCIGSVLKKSKRISPPQKIRIKRAIQTHQKFMTKIVKKQKSHKVKGKRRTSPLKTPLTRIGGGTLGVILSTAIPLLLEHIK